MARKQQAEQQDIEGTREYNAKIEKKAKAYCDALTERMDAQARENTLRPTLLDAMTEEGVSEYYLKSGFKIVVVDKGKRLKIESPQDEDAKDERAKRRQVSLIEE